MKNYLIVSLILFSIPAFAGRAWEFHYPNPSGLRNEVSIDTQFPLIRHCLQVVDKATDESGFRSEFHTSLWSCVEVLEQSLPFLENDWSFKTIVIKWIEQLKFEIPRIPEIQASIIPEIQITTETLRKKIKDHCEGKLKPHSGGKPRDV